MKISIVGCGLRTPLVIHGLSQAGVGVSRVSLYDVNQARTEWMAKLCRHIAEGQGRGNAIEVEAAGELEACVRDASFVISSIRVGDMETRARDERLSLECSFAGQETTGPAGFAMAMRTIPVAIQQAKVVERVAPSAWLLNFTNPAGIVTEAISTQTGVRTVGICDTPAELIHKIACVLGEPSDQVECDYVGLNHLGWITATRVAGVDIGDRARDTEFLGAVGGNLFPAELLRQLDAVPTEYLYFQYRQERALKNQEEAGATRGEELLRLNKPVLADMEMAINAGHADAALRLYTAYLNRRNASYMALEAEGGSIFGTADPGWNPFEGPTGYHRVAVDAIRGLLSNSPRRLILNVSNGDAIPELRPSDVVEVPCRLTREGPQPIPIGPLPDKLRPLILAMKHFERLTIDAALTKDPDAAAFALMANPIVGNWDAARTFVRRLGETDPQHFPTFSS